MRYSFLLFIFFGLFIYACNDDGVVLSPKPRAYPKIEFPSKSYQAFDKDYCNFSFEFPTYATVEQKELFFDEKPTDPCWFDMYIEQFDARIHFSYYPIDEVNTFEKLNFDAFKLSNKHVNKAEFIDPQPFTTKKGINGFKFRLDGPVATPYQFFMTDSTNHFLRGALYFNTKARPDSLAPLVDFFVEDMEKMFETFQWTD